MQLSPTEISDLIKKELKVQTFPLKQKQKVPL